MEDKFDPGSSFNPDDTTHNIAGPFDDEDHVLDSEHYILKPIVPDITFELSDGYAMDFIKFDPARQSFSLDPSTRDYLSQQPGNIAFVINAGQHAIGKTSLFNRCLDITDSERKFTKNSRDIKIWSKPVFSVMENVQIFFVDCEGRDDETFHEFCWIFAFFFGSYVLYSTSGEIDATTWTEFHPLESLSKKVILSDSASDGNFHNLAFYAPRLSWLIKDADPFDFPEALEQPDQYMNTHLLSDDGDTHTKKQITSFFKDRSCFVFPPLNSENEERAQYVVEENIKMIKDTIYSKVKQKIWNGVQLNSRQLMNFLAIVLNSYNPREHLNMNQAFEQTLKNEAEEMMIHAAKYYSSSLTDQIGQLGLMKPLQLLNMMQTQREEALREFSLTKEAKDKLGGVEEYLAELQKEMQSTDFEIIKQYEDEALAENERNMERINTAYTDKLSSADTNAAKISTIIGKALEEYNEASMGFETITPGLNMLTMMMLTAVKKISPVQKVEENTQDKGEIERIIQQRTEVQKKKVEAEEEKKQLLAKIKEMENINESSYSKLSSKKREYESETTKKIEGEKMLAKQNAEFENLQVSVQKVSEKKKHWWMCGN